MSTNSCNSNVLTNILDTSIEADRQPLQILGQLAFIIHPVRTADNFNETAFCNSRKCYVFFSTIVRLIVLKEYCVIYQECALIHHFALFKYTPVL